MQTVILARISDDEQEKGKSINAQKENMQRYCERRDLDVVKVFEFTESSTRGDRKKFHEMIDYIAGLRGKVALVADAVDRVQRGFTDSIILDKMRKEGKLEIHFIREGIVLNEESKGTDIIRWDYAVVSAKSYALNISDNVRRSFIWKLNNGQWVCKAYVGYINIRDENDNSDIVIDNVRAPLVKKAFELYSTGIYSMRSLAKILEDEGLTNNVKPFRPLSATQVHTMIKETFYYGVMKCKGQYYPHKHGNIIDKELYDRCQAVREGYHKKPFKYAAKPFVFRGLVRCAYCGCSISFDEKKNKYIYGCCSKYKGDCGAVRVREEVLLDQVEELFKNITIPLDVVNDLKERLSQSHDSEQRHHKAMLGALRCEYDQIQINLSNLLDLRLNESITRDEYDKKAVELKERQKELDIKMNQHTKADESFRVTVNYLLDLASRAYELFKSSKVDEKRQLLGFVLSNLTLEKEKLHFKLKEPFDAILHANECQEWLPRLDSN